MNNSQINNKYNNKYNNKQKNNKCKVNKNILINIFKIKNKI